MAHWEGAIAFDAGRLAGAGLLRRLSDRLLFRREALLLRLRRPAAPGAADAAGYTCRTADPADMKRLAHLSPAPWPDERELELRDHLEEGHLCFILFQQATAVGYALAYRRLYPLAIDGDPGPLLVLRLPPRAWVFEPGFLQPPHRNDATLALLIRAAMEAAEPTATALAWIPAPPSPTTPLHSPVGSEPLAGVRCIRWLGGRERWSAFTPDRQREQPLGTGVPWVELESLAGANEFSAPPAGT